MCGRYAVSATADDLASQYGTLNEKLPAWSPLYSIAPTNLVPVIHEQAPQLGRVLDLARWDWPKPASMPRGGPIINARMERLDTTFWRGPFGRSRCIVPMSGYFEWTGAAGSKQPHFLSGDELLSAAGLTWTADVAGVRQRVTVVVTRRSQDAAGQIHDRMPAFLDDDLLDTWLDPDPLTDRTERQQLLDTLDLTSQRIASTVRSRLVDRRVNSVRSIDPTDPTLIA